MNRVLSYSTLFLCLYASVGCVMASAEGLDGFNRHFVDDLAIGSTIHTKKGEYLAIGGFFSPFMMKLGSHGEVLSGTQFVLGVDGNAGFNAVVENPDGTYVLVGLAYRPPFGQPDPFVMKTNSNGKTIWKILLAGESADEILSIGRTSDGGFLLVGYTVSYSVAGSADMWVIKLTSSGRIAWSQTFGRSDFDSGFGGFETSDGNYIVAGTFDILGPTGDMKTVVAKLTPAGKLIWSKFYYADTPVLFEFTSITEAVGGHLSLGGIHSNGSVSSGIVLDLDSDGRIRWQKTVRGGDYDRFYSIAATADGGYILAGETEGNGKSDRGLLIKVTSGGRIDWSRRMNGILYSAKPDEQDGLLLAASKVAATPDKNLNWLITRVTAKGIADCGLLRKITVSQKRSSIRVQDDPQITIKSVRPARSSFPVSRRRSMPGSIDVCSQ